MICKKCGRSLHYSGGCNGEWEHFGKCSVDEIESLQKELEDKSKQFEELKAENKNGFTYALSLMQIVDEQKEKISSLEKELEEKNSAYDGVNKQVVRLFDKISLLEASLNTLNESKSTVIDQNTQLLYRIDACQKTLLGSQAQIVSLEAQNKVMEYALRKDGTLSDGSWSCPHYDGKHSIVCEALSMVEEMRKKWGLK